MISRCLAVLSAFFIFIPAGCGYRFVDPLPASEYALVSVMNATAEAGLASQFEEAMRRSGGFKEGSANELSVTITRFNEGVESVGSSGSPVRQELTMEVAWKAEGPRPGRVTSGKETVVQSYPYSTDPATLDWNRSAAVRLLIQTATGKVLESLGGQP